MAQKKKDFGTGGAGTDLLDRNEDKEKIKPPSKYKIIYYNNDHTPMNVVVISLMTIYRHDEETATKLMFSVHEKGREIVKNGLSKEIAETLVDKTIRWFRSIGYPLECTFEKE